MKYRDFSVKVVLNGFIVTIGCQQVVATTSKDLAKLVDGYMDNPTKTEEEMTKNSLNGYSAQFGADLRSGYVETAPSSYNPSGGTISTTATMGRNNGTDR